MTYPDINVNLYITFNTTRHKAVREQSGACDTGRLGISKHLSSHIYQSLILSLDDIYLSPVTEFGTNYFGNLVILSIKYMFLIED